MKKNIFAIAFIAITLCMASCQREEIIPGISGNGENPANTPRVAVTSDLIGTDWTANLALEDLLQAMTGMNLSDYGCEFPEGFDANMTFNGMDGTTASDNSTWTLSSDGELCSELLPSGGCWDVNWITDNTMIISRADLGTEEGDILYQLQFERE